MITNSDFSFFSIISVPKSHAFVEHTYRVSGDLNSSTRHLNQATSFTSQGYSLKFSLIYTTYPNIVLKNNPRVNYGSYEQVVIN